MKKIWKFEIKPTYEVQDIEMPKDSKVIHVGQDPQKRLCIWAEVDEDAPRVTRTTHVIGTGATHTFDEHDVPYIGSAICGPFVWHVYQDMAIEERRETGL